MRRALALFIALLLTLSGLQGNAVAMGLAAATGQASVASAPMADHAMPAHASHTAEHASAAHDCCADGAGTADAQHQGDCPRCAACHTALQALPAALPGPLPAPAALRPAHGARFASAAQAQAIKPPIS